MPSSEFPTLLTNRLILRELKPNDSADLIILRSNEIVNEFIERPKNFGIHDSVLFINKIAAGIQNHESYYWAISLKGDNELIGTICLWNLDKENESIDIGYELHPDYHGLGIMQEAVEKVIEYSFNTLKFKTIFAYIHPDNIKSAKILERNHFVRYEDNASEIVYALYAPQH